MKYKQYFLIIGTTLLFLNSCQKVAVNPDADLSVTQNVSSSAPVFGTNITITLTVLNNGPATATGIVVTDIIPSGYTLVSATPATGTWAATTWTIDNLSSGSSTSLSVIVKVNETGSYTNTASVTGTQTDPVTGNNSSSSTTVPVLPTVLKVTYINDVKPILVTSCTPCHVSGGSQPNHWDVYTTTKANISAIIDRVSRAQGSAGFMPNGGTKLSADNIAILNKWVTDGLLEN